MRKRILVVDDDKAILDLIQNILSGLNRYDIVMTETSSGVLNLLDQEEIDILITDIIMTDLGGIELTSVIKENYPSVKIIIMTAGGLITKNTLFNLAERFGVDYRLEKPFSKEMLISAVEHVLSESEQKAL